MRPQRSREIPGGTKWTKNGHSDVRRSERTKRTAREAIHILGALAKDKDGRKKEMVEQGDCLGGHQYTANNRSIGRRV